MDQLYFAEEVCKEPAQGPSHAAASWGGNEDQPDCFPSQHFSDLCFQEEPHQVGRIVLCCYMLKVDCYAFCLQHLLLCTFNFMLYVFRKIVSFSSKLRLCSQHLNLPPFSVCFHSESAHGLSPELSVGAPYSR